MPSAMSVAMRFDSSRFSISSTSSVMSPSAAASRCSRSSSSSFILILKPFWSEMSLALEFSRSGRSLRTTSASSWSSSPSSVTEKLMSVVSACTSGAKCGFESFVCRKSLKDGFHSTSLSPSVTYIERPFLVSLRPTTEASTASIVSPMFSMSTELPFSRERSMTVVMFLLVSRVTCRSRFDSRSLIQAMPCSCGSIISGKRLELHTIAPFSVETRSEGRPSEFQLAISASSVRILSGSTESDIGILASWSHGTQVVLMSCSR